MNFIAYEGQVTPAQTSSLRYSEGSGLNSSDPVLRSDWRCRFEGLIRTLSELTPAASMCKEYSLRPGVQIEEAHVHLAFLTIS